MSGLAQIEIKFLQTGQTKRIFVPIVNEDDPLWSELCSWIQSRLLQSTKTMELDARVREDELARLYWLRTLEEQESKKYVTKQ
jgi:hypothetical protein